MVSVELVKESNSGRFPVGRTGPYTPQTHRLVGRSMRTIRTVLYPNDDDDSDYGSCSSNNLSDSVMDMRLGELAVAPASGSSGKANTSDAAEEELMSEFSGCSSCSDISGELQRLACLPSPGNNSLRQFEEDYAADEHFSGEIAGVSPEELRPTVEACVCGLRSSSIVVQRSAAAKLRLMAKNRSDFRLAIGEAGAVPALVPLLRCSDPWVQEHAVTALLNLSLHDANKILISHAGAVKALVYALRTGTEATKQNAACALLSLALMEENRSSIGASGAIPPLVSLLIHGSSRGKKDALTTLYKLCSIRQNKERAVIAGAVRPLVGMVAEQGAGMAEKALVVLSSLAGVDSGREAIVEESGIPALVEAVEDGSPKGKEFAVITLLQLCGDNVRNRGLLVREGGIPPLVALSQTGTLRAKHKAEALLGYLREPRPEAGACSSP